LYCGNNHKKSRKYSLIIPNRNVRKISKGNELKLSNLARKKKSLWRKKWANFCHFYVLWCWFDCLWARYENV